MVKSNTINPIVQFSDFDGFVVWGSKTLQRPKSNKNGLNWWIPVRGKIYDDPTCCMCNKRATHAMEAVVKYYCGFHAPDTAKLIVPMKAKSVKERWEPVDYDG